MSVSPNENKGFTLIEISIVLVIIGLVIGGVVVGQDLISAAAVRSQISQIEKYQTAVNTFRGKYGYLPGDMPDPAATNYGFLPRGTVAGEGDGNGLLEGITGGYYNWAPAENAGENVVFWRDLSAANLIDGGFTTATFGFSGIVDPTGPQLNLFFPPAKIGSGNYLYVYSDIVWNGTAWTSTNLNYYGLSLITAITSRDQVNGRPGLTVQQAYNIDQKIDDGLPQTGKVLALYLNWYPEWAYGGTVTPGVGPWGTAAGGNVSGSASTCYDNGNVNGAPMVYSVSQSSGTGINCALSFQFE